jgi:hypothetical protein
MSNLRNFISEAVTLRRRPVLSRFFQRPNLGHSITPEYHGHMNVEWDDFFDLTNSFVRFGAFCFYLFANNDKQLMKSHSKSYLLATRRSFSSNSTHDNTQIEVPCIPQNPMNDARVLTRLLQQTNGMRVHFSLVRAYTPLYPSTSYTLGIDLLPSPQLLNISFHSLMYLRKVCSPIIGK